LIKHQDICNECGQKVLFKNDLHLVESDGTLVCQECRTRRYILCEGCFTYWREDSDDLHPIEDEYIKASGLVCIECLDNGIFSYCNECESYYPAEFIDFYSNLDLTLCESCVRESYSRCTYCLALYHADDITSGDGNNACYSCIAAGIARVCSACGTVQRSEDFMSDNDGVFCNTCWCDRYAICDDCLEWMPLRATMIFDGSVMCVNCASEHDISFEPSPSLPGHRGSIRNNGPIKAWNYRPNTLYFGNDKKYNKQKFGFELEIENVNCLIRNGTFASKVISLKWADKLLYCKEDGSLNNGFEIVSHPFTWGYFKQNRKNFSKLLQMIKDEGFQSFRPGTCGMHVHISKEAFVRKAHLYKFMKFYYDNYDFVFKISQRDEASTQNHCQWGCNKEIFNSNATIQKVYDNYNTHNERYTAINLENSESVEVRIFRGTLNESDFFKNIEFCQATFNFTESSGIKDVSSKNFIKFIKNNIKTFPNLVKFITKNNIK